MYRKCNRFRPAIYFILAWLVKLLFSSLFLEVQRNPQLVFLMGVPSLNSSNKLSSHWVRGIYFMSACYSKYSKSVCVCMCGSGSSSSSSSPRWSSSCKISSLLVVLLGLWTPLAVCGLTYCHTPAPPHAHLDKQAVNTVSSSTTLFPSQHIQGLQMKGLVSE